MIFLNRVQNLQCAYRPPYYYYAVAVAIAILYMLMHAPVGGRLRRGGVSASAAAGWLRTACAPRRPEGHAVAAAAGIVCAATCAASIAASCARPALPPDKLRHAH